MELTIQLILWLTHKQKSPAKSQGFLLLNACRLLVDNQLRVNRLRPYLGYDKVHPRGQLLQVA
jgi:hypothetical protein